MAGNEQETPKQQLVPIPTLEELLDKFRSDKELLPRLQRYYKRVASGQAPPQLTANTAILAAQAMTILIHHILTE